MKTGPTKRLLSLLLSLVLIFSLMSVVAPEAFAADSTAQDSNSQPPAAAAATADDGLVTATPVDKSLFAANKTAENQALVNAKGASLNTVITYGSSAGSQDNGAGDTGAAADPGVDYVKNFADAMTTPVGTPGIPAATLQSTAPVNVIVWLQNLPDVLQKIYTGHGMNVPGYQQAMAAGQQAYSNILNNKVANVDLSRAVKYDYKALGNGYSVFSGFAMTLPGNQISALAASTGVFAVTLDGTMHTDAYTPDPTLSTPGNLGSRDVLNIGALHAAGIDGSSGSNSDPSKPVIVGVIDSGIDAAHPDLAGAFKGGWVYASTATNYNTNKMNLPGGTHGTHVSGIIASQGVNSLGMAPGVSLYMAQVFPNASATDITSETSGSNSDIMVAITDYASGTGVNAANTTGADHLPKADVVNMSLGANIDSAYDAEIAAINGAILNGVAFSISAGNNAYPQGDTSGKRNNYTLGTPGTGSLAVTVAAGQYGGAPYEVFSAPVTNDAGATVNVNLSVMNSDHILSAKSFWAQTNLFANANLYYACSSTANMTAADLTALKAVPSLPANTILVVNRGQAHTDTLAQAQRLGCKALIIINYVGAESYLSGTSVDATPTTTMPIFSAMGDVRQTLLDLVAGGNPHITAAGIGAWTNVALAKEPADFSSIGPVTETAELKPDVIAPGYNVFSTVFTTATGSATMVHSYDLMSGTSMSAPCVTGVLALLKQKFPTATPLELKARLMNTADPFLLTPSSTNDTTDGSRYFNPEGTQISVFEQGAGFINPYRAIMQDNTTYVTVSETVPTGDVKQTTQIADMASFSFGNVSA
ncbi:MAG: S8 family serine peptidase, partial [Firmicutes bacterium]|nr:S8 family serine peptidase [Bacillota bacterium]